MKDAERIEINNFAVSIMEDSLYPKERFSAAKRIYDLTKDPRPDWTPCAEGLPDKVDKRLWSRDVLATIKQKTGNCFVVVAYYHYGHEQWKTDDMTDNDAIDVLAWQPLPAPYNPDRKEDADHIVEANKKIEED